MNPKKVPLIDLQRHAVKTSLKDDKKFDSMTHQQVDDFLRAKFDDNEYYVDSWFLVRLPVEQLVVSHEDFHNIKGFHLTKEKTFMEKWPEIRSQLVSFNVKLIRKNILLDFGYPEIIIRQNPEGPGFRVWDGQLRVCSTIWHEVAEVSAYAFMT